MPEAYDLIVTVTEGHAESVMDSIRSRHPATRVEVVPNRGRDWGPLVWLVNRGLLSGYDAVAKIHTKKSEHRIDGDGWRQALLDGVLESPDAIKRIVALLREDPSVGLVVPTGHVVGAEHWGSDQGLVEMLAYRMGMAFDPDGLQFPGGSMFWCRPWLLERFADLDLDPSDFEPEAGHYDGSTAHGLERLVGVFAVTAGLAVVEAMDVRNRLSDARRVRRVRPRVLAFYLPQFHTIPENDEFWGPGFTDWVNVQKASPLFPGHRQPILPSEEVGFYDLADPDVLRRQAEQARTGGLDGFVVYHYWFDGRTLLDTPIRNWLADPTIDLPIALCWANEPWTRRWDGLDGDVLIKQTYSPGWEGRFWDDVVPYVRDPRYIRVGGAPLLLVYRLGQLPDPTGAIDYWRKRAADEGFAALHVCAVAPAREQRELSEEVLASVDSMVAFPPGSGMHIDSVRAMIPELSPEFDGDVMLLHGAVPPLTTRSAAGPTVFSCVMPGWDNTARRGEHAFVFHGSNPVTFRSSLSSVPDPVVPSLLFVNAWNEWAEGAVLEATDRFADGYLRSLLDRFPRGDSND